MNRIQRNALNWPQCKGQPLKRFRKQKMNERKYFKTN